MLFLISEFLKTNRRNWLYVNWVYAVDRWVYFFPITSVKQKIEPIGIIIKDK